MPEMFDKYGFYLALAAFMSGAFFFWLLALICKKVKILFVSKAPLIQKYWSFVIPFMILTGIAYFIVFKISNEQSVDTNINILGQITALVFAVFIGYYAFLQVAEYKLDKLKDNAFRCMIDCLYTRAIEYFEEYYKIKPRDLVVIVNLLELYLICQQYDKFDQKLTQLEQEITLEERISWFYLKITRFLLVQHLSEAKEEIRNCIAFIKSSPGLLENFSWSFDDLRKSDVYKKLKGESRLILDNFILYLQKGLSIEVKPHFEDGDFELRPITHEDRG